MLRGRMKRSRLMFAVAIVGVVFWIVLYKNMSNIVAKHKGQRLRSRSDFGGYPILGGNEPDENSYNEAQLEQLAQIITADDQRNYDAGYHNHAFNQMLSDKLSFTRPLPDVRLEQCQGKNYPEDLPSVSVVICFHNEARSALLRTIHTVIHRSPASLISEIILVDDFSDNDFATKELPQNIQNDLSQVKLIRTSERQGLIRARMVGAKEASGEVLLFLDSHCEVNVGWLEPLLMAVHKDHRTVAIPIIDIVNADSFVYEASGLVKGGFNWGMHYQWDPLTKEEANEVTRTAEPFKSPTMAGGLFAMNRLYFHTLGDYDSGMDIWGGENLELSFRIWQCGGNMVIVPCSRVGHIFRKRRPYKAPLQDSFTKNTLRMVHVWTDEYKKYYFHINPRAESMDFGNITERLQLRKQLECKSFQWYLENVYPEQLDKLPNLHGPSFGKGNKNPRIIEPDVKAVVRSKGLLKHAGSGLCVESEKTEYDKRAMLRLAICSYGTPKQMWYETEQKDLRLANLLCMDYSPSAAPYARLMKCNGAKPQTWIWVNKGEYSQLVNHETSECLSPSGVEPGALLTTRTCQESLLMQFSLVPSSQ